MIDYKKASEKFKPERINILLIGEAPPPSGKKYFYKVPDNYKPSGTIKGDTSLPATIFNHFFKRRPENSAEYNSFLEKLKLQGVFLIDMFNKPIKIRDRNIQGGINQENLKKIFTDENLTNLKTRIEKISTRETVIIFLLARKYRKVYLDKLKMAFPNAKFIRWIDFRMNNNEYATQQKI